MNNLFENSIYFWDGVVVMSTDHSSETPIYGFVFL